MELIKGSMYNTRNGNLVTIKDVNFEYASPYFGEVVDKKGNHIRVASFNSGGFYKNNGQQSQFDLISVIL